MLTKEEILSTISRINEEKFKELNGRHTVLLDLQEHLINPDEVHSKNFYSIREKLAMAGGRPEVRYVNKW